MAGEPRHLPGLLSTGLRAFSMAPPRLAAFRARLAGLSVGKG
jgi:phosphoenolpyruvate-protein kinase (PTS system EI component)